MLEENAGETETSAHLFSLVHDEVSGVHEWEFMCECGHKSCHESVFLTLAAFVARRESREAVVAPGHLT